eukprot:m51a1_g3301 hypothetical protein (105) ;mRNA; f:310490-311005
MSGARIPVSTRSDPPHGYKVVSEAGIVTGVAAGVSYKLTFSISKALENLSQNIEAARTQAIAAMQNTAVARGANAVLGVHIDVESHDNLNVVVAYGTACVVAPM